MTETTDKRIPTSLMAALRPVTIVCGHYGTGKTNLTVNLALDLAAAGHKVTVIDLDIVNPYFRVSEQRELLEGQGVRLIAPVFAERGTSLDVPSLTGAIAPAIADAREGEYVLIDLGGDDVGSAAMGRFALTAAERDYAMLLVINRHRNLTQEPAEVVENLREIEAASRMHATALIDNAHLKNLTTPDALADPEGFAPEVSRLTGLPVVAKTYPLELLRQDSLIIGNTEEKSLLYPVHLYVKNPWE